MYPFKALLQVFKGPKVAHIENFEVRGIFFLLSGVREAKKVKNHCFKRASSKVSLGHPKKTWTERKEVDNLELDLFDLLRILERRYRLSRQLKVKT